jgi:hypothetical protein
MNITPRCCHLRTPYGTSIVQFSILGNLICSQLLFGAVALRGPACPGGRRELGDDLATTCVHVADALLDSSVLHIAVVIQSAHNSYLVNYKSLDTPTSFSESFEITLLLTPHLHIFPNCLKISRYECVAISPGDSSIYNHTY